MNSRGACRCVAPPHLYPSCLSALILERAACDSVGSPQSAPSRSADAGSNMPSMGSSTGKAPSDMIEQLQQMYQQRRMLQEQQNRGLAPVSGSPQ
jgi:hypothetical protein